MRSTTRAICLGLALAGALMSAGCDWLSGDDAEELADPQSQDVLEVTGQSFPERPAVTPEQSPARSQSGQRPAADGRRRIPLRKSITQVLRQERAGETSEARSAVELHLELSAADRPPEPDASGTPDDPWKYDVRFTRVRISEEVPGEPPLRYDSDSAAEPVPPAAEPYRGLVGHGFFFRLNPVGQLVEAGGYNPFVEQCLEAVSADRRAAARAALPHLSPVEAVAWFVDESIGLVPHGVSQQGQTWMRSQTLLHPAPLHAVTRCTLRTMTAEFADVELSGVITPAGAPVEPAGGIPGARVAVREGKSLGQCRIDRRTGLPVRSRIEQSLELSVRLADGTEYEQSKTTTTTVETDHSVTAAAGSGSADRALRP